MADNTDMTDNTETAGVALDLKNETGTLPTPGEVLRLNRENSGLSLEDVATELNVTVAKVKYLEADEFDKMHSEPFTRGYLRGYAKLLKIDADGLMTCYQTFIGGIAQTEDVTSSEPKSGSSSIKKVLPVIFLLAASGWFVMENLKEDMPQNRNVAPTVESTQPDSLLENSLPESELNTNDLLESDGLDANLEDGADTPPDEPAADAVELDGDNVLDDVESTSRDQLIDSSDADITALEAQTVDRLEFSFTEKSWVEVIDSGSDVLFADVQQAGDDLTLEGTAPFNIVLGNAGATTLALNGEVIASEPENGRRKLKLTVPSL